MCTRRYMNIEEFKELQRKELETFKMLIETDPDKAKEEALARLKAAGIVDENGKLTEW